MASERDVAAAVVDLGLVFGERLSTRAIELYAEALEDVSGAELVEAVKTLIRSHERYFPTPAEIRQAVVAARPEVPALPPPEQRPFADDDRRSLDEILAERRTMAPRWAELVKALRQGMAEPSALPRIAASADDGNIPVPRSPAEVLAELSKFRLPDTDDPAVQHWLATNQGMATNGS